MSRNWSKAVSESNGPVPHQDKVGPDQPTIADLYRTIVERFDRSDKQFDKLLDKTRETNQRFPDQEEDARQPRLTCHGGTRIN